MAQEQEQQQQPVEEDAQWTDVSDQAKGDVLDIIQASDSVPEQSPVVSFDVTCRTADDKLVVVPSHILACSKVFSEMCANLNITTEATEKGEAPTFPGEFVIQNIKEETFLKVVEWCKEHVGLPDPEIKQNSITKERIRFVYTPFEAKFLDVTVPVLMEYLKASNYLDVRSLYSYACQRGAELMSDKPVEQIREEWGFEDDIPEEEKEKIRKDHAWCLA